MSGVMSPRPNLGPKPHLGYTQSLIDRAAERRLDTAWLGACLQDARTQTYVIGGEMIVLKKRDSLHDPAFTPDEARALAPSTETVFLGLLDGAARFGTGISQASAEALKARNDLFVIDLRSIAVQGLVAPEHLPPLAEAKAMLHWHARHRFCSNCGAKTDMVDAGWKRACPACKVEHFPRTDPVAIMLAVRGDRGLLGRSGRFAATMWSCLAGFVEPGEALEDAVRRETLEEAGDQMRPREVSLLAALAVSDVVDERLPRRGAQRRHQDGRQRAGRLPLVHQGRMRGDADAQASGRTDLSAAGRHRPPHHPHLGGERR